MLLKVVQRFLQDKLVLELRILELVLFSEQVYRDGQLINLKRIMDSLQMMMGLLMMD